MPFLNKEQRLIYARKYNKIHYKAHKEAYIKKRNRQRHKTTTWLKNHKQALCCSNCPENHPWCLDFHHTDPTKKDINVHYASNHGWSIDRLKIELEKCIVLCANCHRKEHHRLHLINCPDAL